MKELKVICLNTLKKGTIYDSIENQILVMKGLVLVCWNDGSSTTVEYSSIKAL